MTPQCWMVVVLLGFWISPVCTKKECEVDKNIKKCLKEKCKVLFYNGKVGIYPSGRSTGPQQGGQESKSSSSASESQELPSTVDCPQDSSLGDCIDIKNCGDPDCIKWSLDNFTFYLHKHYIKEKVYFSRTSSGNPGQCWDMKQKCETATYNKNVCSISGEHLDEKFYYIKVGSEELTCNKCEKPVKSPETEHNVTVSYLGEELDVKEANNVVKNVIKQAQTMSESSAQINGGKGVTGIVLKPEPVNEEEITVGFQSPDEPSKIISDQTHLSEFYKVITLSKEAFQKSRNSNNTVTFDAFAVIIKFQNMSKDEKNSTLLVNEVIAITMGVAITNLTDKISIHYKNVKFEGNPVCSSWNGTGSRPVWTDDGCETKIDGDNITCLISHLTYFAILLTPVNETISDSDLKNLTIITRVGCSLSMIFLAVILFMHFLLRRTKANTSTKLLMHLVSSMFLLNLCFLVNDLVASLKNSVACQIMGAAMHYFLLATFTWFAVHAFHLCLHVYTQGIDQISRYLLKVSIPSWGIPSVVVIVLLATGKYGEQVISADVGAQTVTMCWLTNNDVHLIVNVGYYSLVFLFTFTTFIIILTWVVCIRKTKTEHSQVNRSGVDIVTIMGLCCMMGITWGFAFFAYGAARMVFYYVFTVLNSFQGFFLFIYYYKNSKRRPTEQPESSSNTTAVSYGLQVFENPYNNLPLKKLT